MDAKKALKHAKQALELYGYEVEIKWHYIAGDYPDDVEAEVRLTAPRVTGETATNTQTDGWNRL